MLCAGACWAELNARHTSVVEAALEYRHSLVSRFIAQRQGSAYMQLKVADSGCLCLLLLCCVSCCCRSERPRQLCSCHTCIKVRARRTLQVTRGSTCRLQLAGTAPVWRGQGSWVTSCTCETVRRSMTVMRTQTMTWMCRCCRGLVVLEAVWAVCSSCSVCFWGAAQHHMHTEHALCVDGRGGGGQPLPLRGLQPLRRASP